MREAIVDYFFGVNQFKSTERVWRSYFSHFTYAARKKREENMFKKVSVFVFSGLMLLNVCGCVAVVAGAAGGAGTGVWLSGKLTQEFNASYDRTIVASRKSLESLKLELVRETREDNVTQLKSKYTDGKEIWIDIRKVTENSTKVEVRVGAVSPDKEAADTILKKIQKYL